MLPCHSLAADCLIQVVKRPLRRTPASLSFASMQLKDSHSVQARKALQPRLKATYRSCMAFWGQAACRNLANDIPTHCPDRPMTGIPAEIVWRQLRHTFLGHLLRDIANVAFLVPEADMAFRF